MGALAALSSAPLFTLKVYGKFSHYACAGTWLCSLNAAYESLCARYMRSALKDSRLNTLNVQIK